MARKEDDLTARRARKNTELQACEARLHAIMTKSPYGTLIVGTGGVIRFANPAAAAMFGCPQSELTGKRFTPPATPGQTIEKRLQRQDGNIVVVEMWGGETEWDNEKAWIVCLNDVTERKRNEQELHKLYRAVLESPSIVMITDASGAIEFVNPKFTAVTGYTFAEVAGKNPRFLKSGKVPPEVHRELWETIRAGGEWRGEMINRKKNGELYWEYAAISPVKDMEGKITHFIAVTEDVTERKQMEEELRESEARFRATFNQAAVGIAHMDINGRWLRINRKFCDIVGYTEEELKALTIEDITHPDDVEASLAHIQYMLDGKIRSYSLEKRYVRKNGSTVWATLTVSVVVDPDGNPGYFIGVIEDITVRKRAEEEIAKLNTDLAARAVELEHANRELEAFSYSVSHDLRKPLTVINGYCQIIQDVCGHSMDPDCQGYLQEVCDASDRMNKLIDALLTFSCATRSDLHRETVDLSEIANSVAAELAQTEPWRRVTFRIAAGITVDGDASLLRVVLENILGNAWKYTGTREEAVIEFGVTELDGKATCYVRDNGTGFDMAYADKLFIPFQRLPGADEFKGHGIGLATVERIIHRHGGRVWAEGAPGKGATFYFTL